jgi:hypothetical protein
MEALGDSFSRFFSRWKVLGFARGGTGLTYPAKDGTLARVSVLPASFFHRNQDQEPLKTFTRSYAPKILDGFSRFFQRAYFNRYFVRATFARSFARVVAYYFTRSFTRYFDEASFSRFYTAPSTPDESTTSWFFTRITFSRASSFPLLFSRYFVRISGSFFQRFFVRINEEVLFMRFFARVTFARYTFARVSFDRVRGSYPVGLDATSAYYADSFALRRTDPKYFSRYFVRAVGLLATAKSRGNPSGPPVVFMRFFTRSVLVTPDKIRWKASTRNSCNAVYRGCYQSDRTSVVYAPEVSATANSTAAPAVTYEVCARLAIETGKPLFALDGLQNGSQIAVAAPAVAVRCALMDALPVLPQATSDAACGPLGGLPHSQYR